MDNTTEKLMKIIQGWQKTQELPDIYRKNVQEGDYKLLKNRKLVKILTGEKAVKFSGMLAEYVLYTYEDVRDRISELIEEFSGRRVGEMDVESIGERRIKSLGTRCRHMCERLGVKMSDCERLAAACIIRTAIREIMDKRFRDKIRYSVMTEDGKREYNNRRRLRV